MEAMVLARQRSRLAAGVCASSVVDMNLPGIAGLELLALLRADSVWRDPPVILVAPKPSQCGLAKALSTGAAPRILAQPFDVDRVIDTVHDAVRAPRTTF